MGLVALKCKVAIQSIAYQALVNRRFPQKVDENNLRLPKIIEPSVAMLLDQIQITAITVSAAATRHARPLAADPVIDQQFFTRLDGPHAQQIQPSTRHCRARVGRATVIDLFRAAAADGTAGPPRSTSTQFSRYCNR